ncbi:Holliday junction branch migration protein RuvA [Falsibacillus pallidus]|uniref:Holliday junction branch migration protein RuvA n=1 Tax=Falsibacillus pallidus TaxID=493781 RepID=UPI003D99C738
MFEYIKGTLERVGPEYIVLENNGVGYQIFTANPFSFSKHQNKETIVYTYQHVREDILALYGFHSLEEKLLFIRLINVTGIGPKGALAILASGEPEQVINAIENEDESFLVKFPGVGKKTARQMILDLKGKLQDIVPDYFPNLFTADAMDQKEALSKALDEAILALKALGYSEKEVNKVLPSLKGENLSTDGYIKLALKKLLK